MAEFMNGFFGFISAPVVADLMFIVLILAGFVSGWVTRAFYQGVHLVVFILLMAILGGVLSPILTNFVCNDLMNGLGIDEAVADLPGGPVTVTSLADIFDALGASAGWTSEHVGLLTDSVGKAFGLGILALALIVAAPLVSLLFYLITRLFIKMKRFRYNKRWIGGIIGAVHMVIALSVAASCFGAVSPAFTYLAGSLEEAGGLGFDPTLVQFMSTFDPNRSYAFGWLAFGGLAHSFTYHGAHYATVNDLLALVQVYLPPASPLAGRPFLDFLVPSLSAFSSALRQSLPALAFGSFRGIY